jgi:hypothetical protein
MSSGFRMEPREGYLYLHLDPGFEMNSESLTRMWIALSESCRENGLRKVLAEGDNVQRRMTPMDAFDMAGLISRLLPGLSVACCFRGYVPDEQSQFFRTAAMSRGVRSEFFQDLNAALRWLGAACPPKG